MGFLMAHECCEKKLSLFDCLYNYDDDDVCHCIELYNTDHNVRVYGQDCCQNTIRNMIQSGSCTTRGYYVTAPFSKVRGLVCEMAHDHHHHHYWS